LRRPCKIEWVESIVEQCRATDVPVFVKQLDIGGKCVTDINKFPEHLRIRQVPWAKEGETK
jgi:protein gp37